MPNGSDRKHKRLAPLVCAALAVVALGLLLGVILLPLLDIGAGAGVAVAILLLYAAVLVAMIVGVIVALIQRLREIEGGEEDDAAQY